MKLAVFDLDGTLTRTVGADGEGFARAVEDTLEIKTVNSNWSEYEHVTDAGIFGDVVRATLGREPESEEISVCVRRFVQLLEELHCSNRDAFGQVRGANAVLASFAGRGGWRAAIATGAWESAARFKIRVADIAVGALPAAFAEDGPARESIVKTAIARAAELYSAPVFDRVVSIGDAVWDLRTARNLGLPFLGVADADGAARLRELGASHVIEDYSNQGQFWSCLEEATVPGGRTAGSVTWLSWE